MQNMELVNTTMSIGQDAHLSFPEIPVRHGRHKCFKLVSQIRGRLGRMFKRRRVKSESQAMKAPESIHKWENKLGTQLDIPRNGCRYKEEKIVQLKDNKSSLMNKLSQYGLLLTILKNLFAGINEIVVKSLPDLHPVTVFFLRSILMLSLLLPVSIVRCDRSGRGSRIKSSL